MSTGKESRAMIVPTDVELTTDLVLGQHYFERIGRRQSIHEFAVNLHLKLKTKDSLALIISTFEELDRAQMSTPPPLIEGSFGFDAKAAVARGRALAFDEATLEAERAWPYGHTYTGAVPVDNTAPDIKPFSDAAEAERAFQEIEAIVRRLRPDHKCPHTE
ncbi:hypothetical protein C8F04DRAFT_1267869 [Mycena alexandri]|uniref:Uncharacterized protein n=1 Tax=Mycena alexandri TaxID=1745969 RepID=A0AAD6WTK1_9AGAR|nr:hypothetical protein C8F04DRAFT_1267869 [Mycena alexandri]